MNDSTILDSSNGRSFWCVEVPTMVNSICWFCTKWTWWIWQVCRFYWESDVRYRERKTPLPCSENSIDIVEKLSYTHWWELVISPEDTTSTNRILECFDRYVWECFYLWEITRNREDIWFTLECDERNCTVSFWFPLNDRCVVDWFDYDSALSTRWCHFFDIVRRQPNEYTGACVEWCHARIENLERRRHIDIWIRFRYQDPGK
jgi:hypothetical protein